MRLETYIYCTPLGALYRNLTDGATNCTDQSCAAGRGEEEDQKDDQPGAGRVASRRAGAESSRSGRSFGWSTRPRPDDRFLRNSLEVVDDVLERERRPARGCHGEAAAEESEGSSQAVDPLLVEIHCRVCTAAYSEASGCQLARKSAFDQVHGNFDPS